MSGKERVAELEFVAYLGLDWGIRSMCGACKRPVRASANLENWSTDQRRWRPGG